MSAFSLDILIVEDDISLAIDLEMMINEMGYHLIGRVDNGAAALEIIHTSSPDLVLMDIDIKGDLTGIDIAEKIKHLDIPVLFITSFDDEQHFSKAAQTNYIGYLVKPVNKFTLRSTIELTFRQLAASNVADEQQGAFPFKESLFLKKKGIIYKININSILYVTANDDYTMTMTERGEFISSLRLFEVEKILTNYPVFFKTHRSYIVNLAKIDSIDEDNNLLKIGKMKIPVSRRNRPLLMEHIRLLR